LVIKKNLKTKTDFKKFLGISVILAISFITLHIIDLAIGGYKDNKCFEVYGENAFYSRDSKTCECNNLQYLLEGACLSQSEADAFCRKIYGEHSGYLSLKSLGGKCRCFIGYTLKNGKCE
jgi:hypothetical protein